MGPRFCSGYGQCQSVHGQYPLDNSANDWLDVIVCNSGAKPAALEALGLFANIGVPFNIAFENEPIIDCDEASATISLVSDPADPTRILVDDQHWVHAVKSSYSAGYQDFFVRFGSHRPIAATLAAQVKRTDAQGAIVTEAGWDIMVNRVDYSGFDMGYPSSGAVQLAYESGDEDTVKYGVDILTHEFMHVLGAGHIDQWVPSDEVLHTTMYQMWEDVPPFEIHYALEVNSDLYSNAGPQQGERIVPLADQAFLHTYYPVSPPPRTVVVPWNFNQWATSDGPRGAWEPWGVHAADAGNVAIEGVAPNEYLSVLTSACDDWCLDPNTDSDVAVVVNWMPLVASTYHNGSSPGAYGLVTVADGAPYSGNGDPCMRLYENLSIDRTITGDAQLPTIDGQMYCENPTDGLFYWANGFKLNRDSDPACSSAAGTYDIYYTIQTLDAGGIIASGPFRAPWQLYVHSSTSLICGEN